MQVALLFIAIEEYLTEHILYPRYFVSIVFKFKKKGPWQRTGTQLVYMWKVWTLGCVARAVLQLLFQQTSLYNLKPYYKGWDQLDHRNK
jgi:hypothetical protein